MARIIMMNYIIILHKIVYNCCMTKIISDNELFSEGHYLEGIMHIVCAGLFDMYYVCMYAPSHTMNTLTNRFNRAECVWF